MDYVAIACRLLIGVVFAASAATKLVGPSAFTAFVTSVRQMRVVPGTFARPVAYVVVAAEALIVVLVAVPYAGSAVAGFAIAAVLLAAFAVGIVISVRRGERTPCRCFGKSTTPLGPVHVVRNIFLICVTIAGAAGTLGSAGVDLAGAAVAAVAGAVAGALVVALDDIVDLFRPATSRQSAR
ncbi:MauE/DoxX family redox-associated membrane protein [Fodinicola acaciae]|uniref:MauE/DoxX family redox-associated membrane protein n=1 Tax=Fodinicola acaciae TaxID=2681555 RepID=UPI0013D0474D|nr:MauE/DoxX family redox-associated membrane protein [Fodinicola acaciae]